MICDLSTFQPSSLSVRSARPSRASVRPQSRYSERTHSRHARSVWQTLVSKITRQRDEGTEQDPDHENFQEAVEHMVRALEKSTINKAAVGAMFLG